MPSPAPPADSSRDAPVDAPPVDRPPQVVPPEQWPAKRWIVHGMLIGAATGGALGAANLMFESVGEHRDAARYTADWVLGGGAVGLLGGVGRVIRDKYRGGATEPPPGYDE